MYPIFFMAVEGIEPETFITKDYQKYIRSKANDMYLTTEFSLASDQY